MKYEPTNYDGIFKYQLKSGKIQYRIRAKFTASDGRRRERSKQGFDTLAEARIAKIKLEAEMISGDTRALENKDVTFGQYWKVYVETKTLSGEWNRGTKKALSSRAKVWLKRFEHVRLDRITRNDVQKHVLDLYEEENYSAVTMRGFFSLFNRVVNDAVEEGYLQRNIFKKVSIKHPDRDWKPKNKQIPEKVFHEFMELAEKEMRPDVFRCLYMLTFGLRRGEAYGIRQSAITFLESGLTQINIDRSRTLHYSEGKGVKSRESNRIIVVDEKATRLLQEQIKSAKKICAQHNRTLHVDDFIFISPNTGNPFYVDLLNMEIDRIADMIGVDLSPHMFRHTFATKATAAGVDSLQLMKYLGHANIDMTQHYTASSVGSAENVLRQIQDDRD